MGKRRNIIDALHQLRFFDALPRQNQLTVLSYHRLGDACQSPTFEFDQTVFGPTAEVFDDQMKWIAKNCAPVSENDLLAALDGKSKLPRRSVLITFDDAYKDQYTVGLPSLIDHGIPAIFFVTPSLIDNRSLGFWDRLARAVKLSDKKQLRIHDQTFDLSDRTTATQNLTQWIKHQTIADPFKITAEIEALLKVRAPTYKQQDSELMSWAELQNLHRCYQKHGISIGAHGFTHRLLETLSIEEQTWELEEAKSSLEENIGCTVKSLAYPAGSFGPETREIALQCGYTAIFSFESGVNRKKLHGEDIKRVPAGETTSLVACATSMTWGLGASYYP